MSTLLMKTRKYSHCGSEGQLFTEYKMEVIDRRKVLKAIEVGKNSGLCKESAFDNKTSDKRKWSMEVLLITSPSVYDIDASILDDYE